MKKWRVVYHEVSGFSIAVEEFSAGNDEAVGRWTYPAFAHEHGSVILAQVEAAHPELSDAIRDGVESIYRDQYKWACAGTHKEVKRKPKPKTRPR